METFLSLLSGSGHIKGFDRIEIPLIQRDYAQGRKSAQNVREGFIRALSDALINQNEDPHKRLDLDFIYGSEDDDGEFRVFSVLDGQQRLTALFLLHWYAALRDDKMDRFRAVALNDEEHSRFRYDTRPSSTEFFNFLLCQDFDYPGPTESQASVSQIIKDHNRFFLAWSNDPTVDSCLVVLDLIEDRFRDLKFPIYIALANPDAPPITFQFLNLGEFSLSDELYIKMNGRGKPLTPFENFKAWLIGQIEELDRHAPDQDLLGEYEAKLDQDWTDIFWTLSDRDVEEIDILFLNFFRMVALFDLHKYEDDEPDDMYAWMRHLLEDTDELPFRDFDRFDSFNKITLIDARNFLNFFEDARSETITPLLKNTVRARGYVSVARLYARYLFLTEADDPANLSEGEWVQLAHWTRVTDNLLYNVRLEERDRLYPAINALYALKDILSDVYAGLANMEPNDVKFFTKEQIAEEIRKAKLLLEDPAWAERLAAIEVHDYLKGKVGFILDYATSDEGELSAARFEEAAGKVAGLLSKDILESTDYLLQRALLSIDDYMVRSAARRSFCEPASGVFRIRNENWLRVVEKSIFGDLLDRIDAGTKDELNKVISAAAANDWRQIIVRFPETITYCKRRLIYHHADENIYLMTKTMLTAYHAELWTYAIGLWLTEKDDAGQLPEGIESHLYRSRYGEEMPSLVIENSERVYEIVHKAGEFSLAAIDDAATEDTILPPFISACIEQFKAEVF